MPQFSTKRRVKHSAADMFDLVADVEHYPEFVPLCRAMRVMRRTRNDDREVVVVKRRKGKDVALIDADELSSLLETAHLLRSPRNAQLLIRALRDAERGTGKSQTVDEFRKEIGLAPR